MHERRVSIPDPPIYIFCSCCKNVLDRDDDAGACATCGEYTCEPVAGSKCKALCKCNRSLRGRVTQMWFRKVGEVYAALFVRTQNKERCTAC